MKAFTGMHTRLAIAVGSLVLYALLFSTVYSRAGTTAAVLCAFPGLVFGWTLGARGALVFGVLVFPLNLMLFYLQGSPAGGGILPNLVGTGTITLVSLGVGRLKDLSRRVTKQAQELLHEHQQLQTEIERRVQAEERLTHEVLHDPLTNLANRRLFLNRLEHAIAWSKRHPDGLCAVLYLDLDKFKRVNDSLGHEAGDRLLVDVARRLKSSVRDVDTVARMGGDEFAILIEGVIPPQQQNVEGIVKRIQENLAAPCEGSTDSCLTQTSMGVFLDLDICSKIDDALRNADIAMYRAKADGGNCYRVFQPEMKKQSGI